MEEAEQWGDHTKGRSWLERDVSEIPMAASGSQLLGYRQRI